MNGRCPAAISRFFLLLFAAALLGPSRPALAQALRGPVQPPQDVRLSEPPLEGVVPTPANPPATAALDPTDPPVPCVAVRVRVPASAEPNKELEYRIFVDNISVAAAHHVTIRVPQPANARFVRAQPESTTREGELQWSLGTLPARARREISLVLVPTGEEDVRCCARVQFEHGQCVRTQLARSALRLRKEGPPRALIYDALTYRLEVINSGTAPALNVVLTDTLPDGLDFSTSTPSTSGDNPLTWQLGTLAPGQSRKIEYQVFAKKSGSLSNKALVTAAGGQRQEASSTVLVEEAKVTASKTGPKRRIVNSPAVYQISVNNTGTMPVIGLEILDKVPGDLAFVSASDGGQFDGSAVRWALGSLAPGARRSVQIVLRGRKPGEFINRATITGSPRVDLVAEARTVFEGATGISLEIDKGEDPLEVGRPATYTMRVFNQGSAAASNLGLTVTTTDHLKIVSGRGPTNAQQTGNRLVFAPLPALAPGANQAFIIATQAQQAGDARLRVELTADQLAPGSPLKQEESTTIFGQ